MFPVTPKKSLCRWVVFLVIGGQYVASTLKYEVEWGAGGGVLLLFGDALGICPFGVGAYRLLVTISGPKCKILERPPHMTNQVL